MGVIYDYFAADSDEQATSVIDRIDGPRASAASPPGEASRHGLFRRRGERVVPQESTPDPVLDTVPGHGIDPVVQMGTLEELLTGRSYSDEIARDPRSGHTVAVRDGGDRHVLTLTQSLATALAGASDERLAEIALPWSQTEEFWGDADPEVLTDFLHSMAALARRADANQQLLFCWVCV